MDPTNHVLLSNRSAAYVGLEQFSKALDDANACLQSKPDFVKGYSRKAYAYVQLKQPGFAEAAYREGLAREKHNAALKQGLESILKVGQTLMSKNVYIFSLVHMVSAQQGMTAFVCNDMAPHLD